MYHGAEGHELQRMRHQGYTRFLSCSLLGLHFCLSLPAEFSVDMWITEYTSSGQTDCLKCLTHAQARTHTHSASAATEECFLHRWCEKILHFHRDTLMKLSVASLSSSLHFNFKTPAPPPPTPPPPHCCSNSSPTLLSSPFPLLLAFYHPLVPAFFPKSLLAAMVAPPPTLQVPPRHPNLSSLIRLPFAPTSSLFQ